MPTLSTHRIVSLALAAAAMLLPLAASSAQQRRTADASPSAAQALDAATRRDVVDTISVLLRRHYVDADTGKLIAAHLADRLKAGAYDQVTDPYRFAELLTDDLRAVNGDKHLMVAFDRDMPGMHVGPEGIRMLGDDRVGRRTPSPQMVAQLRRGHFALGRVDVLSGNVGYLDIRGFSGSPEAQDALVDALRYLQYTDAMILDLRRNGGGSAELVNFMISHFTGPDTIASLTVKNRSGHESFTRYTLAKVPGPRRPDVPLYVLTSPFTASAGEDFSFVLKNMGRATIVGEPTAGAGHNNALLDAGHGFATSISFTRVMDPKTGAEWERVGVQPTVRVDQEQALLTAQSLALKAIAAKENDPQWKGVLAGMSETIDAQLRPVSVEQATLASYAGEYEGGQHVWLHDGQLMYGARPGAPGDPLVPLGMGRFAFGATRLLFEGSGTAAKMRITRPDGRTMSYGRVTAP